MALPDVGLGRLTERRACASKLDDQIRSPDISAQGMGGAVGGVAVDATGKQSVEVDVEERPAATPLLSGEGVGAGVDVDNSGELLLNGGEESGDAVGDTDAFRCISADSGNDRDPRARPAAVASAKHRHLVSGGQLHLNQ